MITDINFWNKIVIVLSSKYPELFYIDLLEKCVNDRRLLEIQVHVYVDFTDNKVISISTVPIPRALKVLVSILYAHVYTCIYNIHAFTVTSSSGDISKSREGWGAVSFRKENFLFWYIWKRITYIFFSKKIWQ